jgi:hypothetical protein
MVDSKEFFVSRVDDAREVMAAMMMMMWSYE